MSRYIIICLFFIISRILVIMVISIIYYTGLRIENTRSFEVESITFKIYLSSYFKANRREQSIMNFSKIIRTKSKFNLSVNTVSSWLI